MFVDAGKATVSVGSGCLISRRARRLVVSHIERIVDVLLKEGLVHSQQRLAKDLHYDDQAADNLRFLVKAVSNFGDVLFGIALFCFRWMRMPVLTKQ